MTMISDSGCRVVSYGVVMFWLLGCQSQPILLGRGDSDAGSESSTSAAASTTESPDECSHGYMDCVEATPSAICQDVLILCRVALPDGGPPCEEVYSSCLDIGFPAADCEHAAQTCDETRVELGPGVDSTLRAE